jgi:peptide/nickel transport system permease protein
MKKKTEQTVDIKRPSRLKEVWRRLKKNKVAMMGLVLLIVILFVLIFANFIVPYDKAISQDVVNRLQKPSAEHWFGTDGLGRDEFARIIHGARNSMSIGIIATLGALVIGGMLGTIGAYCGGKIDNIIMRLNDVMVAIPVILLALVIVSALGASLLNLIIAISVARVPYFIRVIRSSVLGIVDQEYVEAAKAGGVSDITIIFRHIIPNAVGTIIVQTTMSISFLILQAATLSFLGMGIQAPAPEWGYMLSEAKEFARSSGYLLLFPGVCICMAALAFNLLGDGLRDALDPRLKN